MGVFGRLRRHDAHSVEVHDVRPLPGDPEPFARYFAAVCECGWLDVGQSSEAGARAAALSHHANVDPELKRPLG